MSSLATNDTCHFPPSGVTAVVTFCILMSYDDIKNFLFSTLQSQQSSKKLESVFNAGEEEQANDSAPKKKLSKIEAEEDEEKRKAATADEKKKIIRNLIEKIPTAKDELFQFPVKMDMIDQVMNLRLI